MSTHRPNRIPPRQISEGELYARVLTFGLVRGRRLRAVAVRKAGQSAVRGLAVVLMRCGDTLWTWQNRYNARRHMASLDRRLLEDVGITRADIERVAARPFWRA